MTPAEFEKTLQSITILADTREQPTEKFQKRMKAVGFPFRREKLDFGDYSAEYEQDGQVISLRDEIAIERKMSLDEICGNFTKGRKRFEREFERACAKGAKIHLIIENASYEKINSGKYRSRLTSNSLNASLFAFCDRYNITVHFCNSDTTASLIRSILYYHIRNKIQAEELKE